MTEQFQQYQDFLNIFLKILFCPFCLLKMMTKSEESFIFSNYLSVSVVCSDIEKEKKSV